MMNAIVQATYGTPDVLHLRQALRPTVGAIGSGVTRFTVGEEVFGLSRGSLAEYASARADKFAHQPAGLDFEHAAVPGVGGNPSLSRLRRALTPRGTVVFVGGEGDGVLVRDRLSRAYIGLPA